MKINIGFYYRVFFYPLFIILLLLFVFASLFNSKTIERNVLGLVAMILTSKEEFLQLLKFVVEGALVFFLEW